MRPIHAWTAGCTLVALGSLGCIDLTVLGIPLGPQGGTGLIIKGVLQGTGCTYTPNAAVHQALGWMELNNGKNNANMYQAVLDVENNLPNNKNEKGVQQAPNQGGAPYGTTNTNDVELVGAHVRYEYPKSAPLDALQRTLARPLQGTPLAGVTTDASGNIPAAGFAAVLVTLIDPEFALQLYQDPEIKKAALREEGYPIIAKVTLEGRTGQGTRVTSNELTFKIILSTGYIANCQPMDTVCQEQGETYRAQRNFQCFPDQDMPECACNYLGPTNPANSGNSQATCTPVCIVP